MQGSRKHFGGEAAAMGHVVVARLYGGAVTVQNIYWGDWTCGAGVGSFGELVGSYQSTYRLQIWAGDECKTRGF